MNLRDIDLNLLVVLQALFKHRHITQTAQALQMSQPAVSRALSRLRKTLGDPLLVRTSQGYDLSNRGKTLQPQLEQVLTSLKGLISTVEFNPAESKDTLSIYGLDSEITSTGLDLFSIMHHQAPNMFLDLRSEPMDQFELLDSGEVHFAISALTPDNNQDHYHRLKLNKLKLVVIMRKQHPLADQLLTLDNYLEATHGMISITGQGALRSNNLFKELGRKPPKVSLRLSSFSNVAYFCEAEDILFHLPKQFAEKMCEGRPIFMHEQPKELNTITNNVYLYWHKRHHHNPMCQWVRQQIKATKSPSQ